MPNWTGETQTVQAGPKWTYKLRLEEKMETGAQSKLILGIKIFDSEEEAKRAGEVHLNEELKRRSTR